MTSLQVHMFPCLQDNYGFLVHDPVSGETACVDTPDPQRILQELANQNWQLTAIFNTHWHPDHTGGNQALKEATGCHIYGPARENIPNRDTSLEEGDTVTLGEYQAHVLDVPGHTAGHIAYAFADDDLLFIGDTLFALGCGRLFEGTPEQMFASLQKIARLPDTTTIYCAHEYTQANARFALTEEPDNTALVARARAIDAARATNTPTVPTTLALEKSTNPFLRAPNPAAFAALRARKDAF